MKNKIFSFITQNKIMLIVSAAFLVFGILLGQKLNFSKPPAHDVHADVADDCEKACQEGHGHDAHDHDAHSGEGEEGAARPLSELEKMTCEHRVGIIDCNQCRYEVGVVKIDPSIASLIQTGLAAEMDRTQRLTFTGQVQLDRTRTVEVVSTGGGRVEQVTKFLGEKVEKGDVLAVIHSADLGQVKADFLEVQAKRELTEATFRREKELYEKKITSQADYLDAQNELKTAQAAYAAADKRLRLFGLGTEQIAGIKDEKENEAFANLILYAPQGGTIIAQDISAGKMVDTVEGLFTIADLSTMWVWCDVYEKDLAILHEHSAGDPPLEARVTVRAFESVAFGGVVDFVDHVMDEHTRTVKMRVQVKNPDNKLRPGMFADVEIAIPLPERMLAVLYSAVMSDAGKNFVFQHWKEDLWIRRDVAVGNKYGELVEILGGLPHGATIITGGAFMLKSDVLREKMGAGCAD